MPFQKQNVCIFELIYLYFYFQWTQSRSTSRLTPSTGRRTRRTWPRTATTSSPLSIRTSSTGIHPPSALGSSSWRCPLPSLESSSTSPSWSQLFIHIVPKRNIVFHIKMFIYLYVNRCIFLVQSWKCLKIDLYQGERIVVKEHSHNCLGKSLLCESGKSNNQEKYLTMPGFERCVYVCFGPFLSNFDFL